MKTRIEKIGPEQAEIYLQKNLNNRPLSRFQVTKYAALMEQGRWMLNGEPIISACDGTLLDGQHRLAAIMMASVTVECFIVEGLPREVFATLGTGAKRNTGDIAAMLGCKYATWVAATLSCLYRLELGMVDQAVSAPNDKIEGLLRRYPEVQDVVADAGASAIKKFFSIGLFSGFYIWLSRVKPIEATEFFGQLKSGVGLISGSPILLFRERMLGLKKGKTSLPAREVVALLIKAWNAHLSGKWPKQLKYASSGPAEEKFPTLMSVASVPIREGISIRKLAA